VSADLQGSQNRTSLSQNREKQKKKLQIDQNLVLKFGRIKTGLDQLTRKTGWLAGPWLAFRHIFCKARKSKKYSIKKEESN
jgi:hypothetical protein